jgi:L-lactate utilization protein LutB
VILLKNSFTLNAIGSMLAFASLALRAPSRLHVGGSRKALSDLDLSTLACTRCGACVTVCPAYLITGREIVTGRGKLLMARKLKGREPVDSDEAKELFLCMKCHACEEVCQTRLPLLSAYEELEGMVDDWFGRPKEMIENFVAEVEASPEYERLLYEGVISPDAGMKDGDTDAV